MIIDTVEPLPGCKESQFYSLSLGQAVASTYKPRAIGHYFLCTLLSTRTEESGPCGEVDVVKRFNQESMYVLSA